MTGIKAHTLRMWEKRYGIIHPRRTETNIRYYRDEDLKSILNIATLNKHGYKISAIARMSPEEIRRKIAEISDVELKKDDQLDSLTLSMLELDEHKFNAIVDKHIEQNGFEFTLLEVIMPFLDKVGLMWLTGSIKQVHEKFHELHDQA